MILIRCDFSLFCFGLEYFLFGCFFYFYCVFSNFQKEVGGEEWEDWEQAQSWDGADKVYPGTWDYLFNYSIILFLRITNFS